MTTLIWLAIFTAAFLAMGYFRTSLRNATIATGALLVVYSLSNIYFLWGCVLWLGFLLVAAPLNVPTLRKALISQPVLGVFRKVMPSMSPTEQTALEAGSVWWDGELFSGQPNWERLQAIPPPVLSDEEQAFIDGPVAELIGLCDEWQISHEDADLSPAAWKFIKQNKFFGMIIPKAYGGLEFSAYAHSCVLAKLGSAPAAATVGSTVAVPNSLGPAELLLHYGTQAQKDHYLPRLATGEEIPCFALTSPHAGSDAGAIPDTGIVCKGKWQGKEVIGMKMTWDKRYITLAPVATVLGLAFKMYDPEHLLGDTEALGVTCALIPTDTKGVKIGRRHFPLNTPFQNGPTQGEDVFIPLDYIIGGVEMAGQGWRMLMECLSVGRSISLPSMATGSANAAAFATGAYARIRRQFNVHIGAFEGVQEALARIAGRAYACESVRRFTANAVDLGEKPSVPSAIAKYHCTNMSQQVAIDAMDVHGGKGVCLGPSNYIGRSYQGAPIMITVEGANILTRSMMIFGQGAIRCHPYVLKEMQAAQNPDGQAAIDEFDAAFFGHVGHVITAVCRSLVLGISHGYGAKAPQHKYTKRHYQKLSRYAANLALMADAAMASLGGQLKFRESISARLGDVLSMLYIASASLKRFEEDGAHAEDALLLQWVCEDCFARIEAAMDGVLRNLPNRPLAWILRPLVFPLGRQAQLPQDAVNGQIADMLQNFNAMRERLSATCHIPQNNEQALGLLDATMREVLENQDLEKRVLQAYKSGQIQSDHPEVRITECEEAGILDSNEADKLRTLYALLLQVISVDDFDSKELQAAQATNRKKARGDNTKRTQAA